jgi:hypothetical protein
MKLGLFLFWDEGKDIPTLLGVSEGANLNHCTTYVSKY